MSALFSLIRSRQPILATLAAVLLAVLSFAPPARGADAAKSAEFKRHFDQALAFYREQRFEEVIPEMDAALFLAPGHSMGWSVKGYSVFYTGNPEEAVAAFDQAIRLDAKNFRALYGRGLALNTLRRFPEAEQSLERATALAPERANYWHLLGLARFYGLRFASALEAFEKLLQLSPERADAWGLKGMALFELARYPEALAAFDEALQRNARADDLWMSRGSALVKLGRLEDAVQSYQRALAGNPFSPETLYSLAVAQDQLGRREDAMRSLEKALAVREDYGAAQQLLDQIRARR